MDLSLAISIISLTIALFVAIYSIYNIERDNAKIEAWAEVSVFHGFSEKNAGIKTLIVTIANVGRRPIIVKGLKVESKAMSFDIPAKEPDTQVSYNLDSTTDFEVVNEEIREHFATKNTCVVLKEGEFFERELAVSGKSNDLVTFIEDELHEGENVYIQDIQGRLYSVDNFKSKFKSFQKET
jgi:hypothetical protein